ncbi:hypothetical protein C8R43DRAFT_1034063 [Mycena crocata]|nr:hypothetical protein C8R43DRAFT_1034063 [Mycena crocata]
MHPSLRPQSFAALPVLLKRLANSAANGSLRDLRILTSRLRSLPQSQAALLLPAFYANLGPDGIPEQPELIGDDYEPPLLVACALEAITGIIWMPGIQNDVFPDLWARFWPWIDFLQKSGGSFSATAFGDKELYISFLVFCKRFIADDKSNHEEISNLLAATPGVRLMLARGWRSVLLLGNEDRRLRDETFIGLFGCLLGPAGPSTSKGLAEFIDGAGGISGLASVIVSTFDKLVPTRDTVLSRQEADFLLAAFTFLSKADRTTDRREDIPTYALCAAMRPLGFARALTTTLCALAQSTVDGADIVMYNCLHFLAQNFTSPSMLRWVGEALRYGLLHGLLVAGSHNPDGMHQRLITLMFTDALPPALIYHRVVAGLKGALSELGDSTRLAPAKQADWIAFSVLAHERVAVLKSLEESKWASFRACDNLQCSRIRDSRRYARCAGCRGAYYCSRDCQTADWRAGHKQLCTQQAGLCLNEFLDFTWHDRAFLRAVVHHDYRAKTSEIARGRAQMIPLFRDAIPLLVFTYCQGPVSIEVQPGPALISRITPELRTPEWNAHVARAAGSEGRIELHVVRLSDGTRNRYVLVPLRRNGGNARKIDKKIDVNSAGNGFDAYTADSTGQDDINVPTEIH